MKRKKLDITAAEASNEPTLKKARSRRGLNAGYDDHRTGNHEPTMTAENSEAGSRFGVAKIEIKDADEDEEAGLDSDASLAEPITTTSMEGILEIPNKLVPEASSKRITPKKHRLGKKLFATPIKSNDKSEIDTPRIERNADRSARRKSTRTLIERTILGDNSDNYEEDDNIVQRICGSDEEETDEVPDESTVPETPSKRGKRRGTKAQRRSLTPPQDLTAHEKYFFQNGGGRAKTSNNNLSSLALLDHEEFFDRLRGLKDKHADDIKFLEQLHAESFKQWQFELSQGFSICAFGWGSKRSLLMQFADHTYKSQAEHTKPKIVIVNGYVNNLTIRDVLNTVAVAFTERGHKLGSQPNEMLDSLIELLEEDRAQHVTLVIHSIDRIPLRRPGIQTILSRLSSHPQVHLVSSADHPSFPLLWDSSLRSAYNFLFHDCTTFQSYISEVDVIDEVHELLGRTGRRVGGKDGVSFVLKSLPENAKKLFSVLIGEQLAAMDEGNGTVAWADEDEDEEIHNQGSSNPTKPELGVEYRALYQKATEEFICSNDMNFRTLLKEFHDHQMVQSRKDALGTEILSVPFGKEELETILEDIAS
ncbi:origin recognition complex subunit 2 [Diplocarpon rosae]|nr:origin recognition complex subunit 2 [Diplocarpon rosae]